MTVIFKAILRQGTISSFRGDAKYTDTIWRVLLTCHAVIENLERPDDFNYEGCNLVIDSYKLYLVRDDADSLFFVSDSQRRGFLYVVRDGYEGVVYAVNAIRPLLHTMYEEVFQNYE